jgi:hypothetical protein
MKDAYAYEIQVLIASLTPRVLQLSSHLPLQIPPSAHTHYKYQCLRHFQNTPQEEGRITLVALLV